MIGVSQKHCSNSKILSLKSELLSPDEMHRPLAIVNFNSNPYSSEAQRSKEELLGPSDCGSCEAGTRCRQNISVAVETGVGVGRGEG